MTDRIDLTWQDGKPMRIVDQELISQPGPELEVIEAGKKVIKQTRTEYTAVSVRPATEAEVRKWRRQA